MIEEELKITMDAYYVLSDEEKQDGDIKSKVREKLEIALNKAGFSMQVYGIDLQES